MAAYGRMALIAALLCFCIFFGNVAMGASGQGVFLGDVAEMLMLFAAALLFVIGVLIREVVEPGTEDET